MGHAACTEKAESADKALWNHKRRWMYNTKLDLTEAGREELGWVNLAQKRTFPY